MRVDQCLPLSALSLSLGKVGPLSEAPLLFGQPAGYARATKNDTPDVSRHNVVRHRSHASNIQRSDRMETPALADAAPVTGIVWAYRFRPDGVAELISNDKIEAALAERGTGWMWLHLALADTRCRAWIAQHAPISELARDVLAGPDRHLRLDIIGNEIVGVLPDLHQEFAQP